MKKKECFKCGTRKSLTEFYKHPQMKDGRVNKCKECNKQDVRDNRRKRIDYYTDYEQQRAMLPHRIAQRTKYEKTEAGKRAVQRGHTKYRETYPIRNGARIIVNNAVRDKRLAKSKCCSECGISGIRIHGHHDDYAKPLEVRWLCCACHRKWHTRNGSGLNG